ncbi:hypothetical protein MMC20_005894 [Loxospora ochrophaea]|nr:hypothetical protein [Loxospora ochrophaea]
MLLAGQLSIELTNVFSGLVKTSVARDLFNYARELRKSGSDILVEEDLALVFGRGKIVYELERQFKESMKTSDVRPLYPNCEIVLQSGPGPTVTRAMRDQQRMYMSTVIQLSFLAWLHNRADLASSIVVCMGERIKMGVEGISEPGLDDVESTLQCCSSQTSAFDWSPKIQTVEHKIRTHFEYHERAIDFRHIKTITTGTLLAAMDYLYLVQSLPEDRKMVCDSEEGKVPLVIWAHHILGLTLLIRSSSKGDLSFGDAHSPQIIIYWRSNGATSSTLKSSPVLLDKTMDVVLKSDLSSLSQERIRASERHHLKNYGVVFLQRYFNDKKYTCYDDPVYTDSIELILALVTIKSREIRRSLPIGRYGDENLSYSLER